MSWMEHQEEPPSEYERKMRAAYHSQRESVTTVDFGDFDGETLHCSHSDLDPGTVVANKTRHDSKGELYVVTRVGRASVINERFDATHWQEYGVTPINERELMLVRLGFSAGWEMCEFIDSHLSQEEASWEQHTEASNR
jgi:hypothetical protein